MTPSDRPIDQDARDRLRVAFGQTFFVEAGAGTGKTTVLVARVVALVKAGRLRMPGLVAITFTEAAAAELRGRIRTELEEAAAQARSDEERERCAEAAATTDLAAIQTIHAFAAALLRTYPIEAGLPPGFQVWDDVQFTLAFDERFRVWLAEDVIADDAAGRARRAAVERALLLGLKFDDLRALAGALQEHTDLRSKVSWPKDMPRDPVPIARAIGEALWELTDWIRFAKNGEADPLVQEVRRLASSAPRLRAASDEEDALLALLALPEPNTLRGKMADFGKEASGTNAAKTIKDRLKEVKSQRTELLDEHRTAALHGVLDQLWAFTLDFAQERRRLGVAAFHDLLVWARDLLHDNDSVRTRARARFEQIFVDEFQDTDPLQAEIIWFLAVDPSAPPAGDWVSVGLQPGKLFVVGDPKQSIYRFRGADIRLVADLYARGNPRELAQLRQNFRSARPVLTWANHHFARDFGAGSEVQAPHVDLGISHEGPAGAKVIALGEAREANMVTCRADEARDIARLIRTAVDEGWPVREGEKVRRANYGDICLLMPARTGQRVLEDALEEAAVPYRVESGSLVLATQEVRDVISVLRAIDDPSDQVALVAALRSAAYACSDVDLLGWVEAGGTLDYQRPSSHSGPVAEGFASLRRFHQLREGRSAAWLIEALIRERALAIQTFGYPHPREAWRRLRYLVAQARALAGAGRPGLRSLVNWLEDCQREGVRDRESPRPDSDEEAVRLMTIHGAKGLEFPIVILSDLGRRPSARTGAVLRDRDTETLRVRIRGLETPGYREAAETEKAYERAESVRLLYVAATRARDYLALSLHRKLVKKGVDKTHAGRIEEFLREAPDLVARISLADPPPTRWESLAAADADGESLEAFVAEEDRWRTERERRVALGSARARLTVGELVRRAVGSPVDPATSDGAVVSQVDGEGEVADDLNDVEPAEARRIGRAVHAMLESSAWGTRSEVSTLAAAIARRFEVADPGRVERLTRGILASALVGEAREARQRWHEVPIGVEVNGVLLEGRIDLLFVREDGTLAILDFKTGAADPEIIVANSRADRLQGGAYALAITRATGQPVSLVGIVYAAREGYTVQHRDVAAMIAEVEQVVIELTGQ